MDPISISMLLGSIGLQYFTNYTTTKKSRELQEQQEKYRKEAQNKDFEHMRLLQEKSFQLSLEMEAEMHAQRMAEINHNYDTFIEQLAHGYILKNWPINVLPFVMKGESFGSYIGGSAQTIAIHCIVTPSNYDEYNRMFYNDIDSRLEIEMNNKWHAQSTHPIVYYGGAWKKNNMYGIPNVIDLNDIDILETQLENTPTIVITPYFDSKIYFRVRLWGMGQNSIANLYPSEGLFSYDYEENKFPNNTDGDFYKTTVEEFVCYLEGLIGSIADKYFWSLYGVTPQLPLVAEDSPIMKLLFRKELRSLYMSGFNDKLNSKQDFIRAIDYIKVLKANKICDTQELSYDILHSKYVEMFGDQENEGMLLTYDVDFLSELKKVADSPKLLDKIKDEIKLINENQRLQVIYCACNNELIQCVINEANSFVNNNIVFVISWINEIYGIGYFTNSKNQKLECSIEGIIYYIILKHNSYKGESFSLDLNTLQFTQCNIETPYIPLNVDEIKKRYESNRIRLKALISTYKEVQPMLSRYLADAPVLNVKYQDLKDWADRKCPKGSSLKIVIGYNNDEGRYFLLGLNGQNAEAFACYCNTLDRSIKSIIKNKTVLIINN